MRKQEREGLWLDRKTESDRERESQKRERNRGEMEREGEHARDQEKERVSSERNREREKRREGKRRLQWQLSLPDDSRSRVVPPGTEPQAGAIGVDGAKEGDGGQGCSREAASSCCFRVLLGTSTAVGERRLLRRARRQLGDAKGGSGDRSGDWFAACRIEDEEGEQCI